MSPNVRLLAGSAALALWLALLLSGVALGGAVHLLGVLGLALWPWRAATAAGPSGKESR